MRPTFEQARRLPIEQRRQLFREFKNDPKLLVRALFAWSLWARPDQMAPTHRDWFVWFILAGRGWGKALGLETPIPTPGGWKAMGEIEVGDVVFDEAGRPCTVTAVFDPDVRRAFRVTFSDGTSIDACEDHQWVTLDRLERKRLNRRGKAIEPTSWAADKAPVTTAHLFATQRAGGRGDLNHAIPLAAPLCLPDVNPGVDPYVLGLWLGDGESKSAVIHCGDEDVAHVESALQSAGYTTESRRRRTAWAVSFYAGAQLRELGVLRNKHIPPMMMRASETQRRALLAGLMDSDGSAEKSKVEFCSCSKVLAIGVLELARSLGEKPTMTESDATLNGRVVGRRWRVRWRPLVPPFRLERKNAAVSPLGAQSNRNRHRMVVSVEEIEPRPMRCLTVDSPNSMFLAGEGMVPTHNTRTASEWVKQEVDSGRRGAWAFVSKDPADARDVMIEGRSGILAVYPPDHPNRPKYEPSKKRITWPNGARATVYSGEDPEAVRGPEFDGAWADELAAWRYPKETWENLELATRQPGPQGHSARIAVTTTPKPIKVIKDILSDPDTVVTRGSTYDNLANLDPKFKRTILRRYEGTRLGRQELHADILEEAEGALWTRELLEGTRIRPGDIPGLRRIVVGVDPMASADAAKRRKEFPPETGITVAGLDEVEEAHVLRDLSVSGKPAVWGRRVVAAVEDYEADCVVAEVNNGGDMVEDVIRNVPGGENIKIKQVRATRGKWTRAEPIQSFYELAGKRGAGKVHHVGFFPQLEDQLCNWTGANNEPSPDRLDAHVWALTELLLGPTVHDVDMDPTALQASGYFNQADRRGR